MKFSYGKKNLEISIDPNWNSLILSAREQDVIENPIQYIKNCIRTPIDSPPLKELVTRKKEVNQVLIVVSDATRPLPSNLILKALVDELNRYGIEDDKITILIATGLHRESYEIELERILGKKLKTRIEIINHNAKDEENLIFLGNTIDNVPIFVNKHYVKSDLKILTGYVEPHFFFGFSGGKKSIVPGIAGAKTIQANHSAKNIDSPFARFGTYENNPLVENAAEIAKIVGTDFVINVCINEDHEITQIAAGNVNSVHKNLVDYQLEYIFRKIDEPFDIVVCGNGGYPLDLNLYQAVKSMAIGELIVKKGGTIISVNECSDGIGIGHEMFKQLLFSNMPPKQIYDKILHNEILVPDQWEIQILTRIMMKADIVIVSSLKKEQLGNIGLKYEETLECAVNKSLKKHGMDARILILPNGPQVIPQLKK